MGVFTNISTALNSRLNNLSGLPPVAWPNVTYTPTLNTTYIRPTILPAQSVLSTLAGTQEHRGIYQIDIYVPVNKGVDTLYALLDSIEEHFLADSTLTQGDDQVFIQQVGIGRAERQDAWYTGYVEVYYLCYS